MELVGHDNEEMSQHYTRVGRTALKGAARAFPDLLAVFGDINTNVVRKFRLSENTLPSQKALNSRFLEHSV